MKNKTVILSFLSLLLTSALWGQGLFQITDQPLTARGLGLQAVSTFSLDGAGLFYNPSVISDISRSAQLDFTSYSNDINITGALAVFPSWNKFATALFIRHLNYGVFTEKDNENTVLGEFAAAETQAGFAISRKILNKLRLGIAGSWLFSSIQNYNAGALAGSAGLRYYDPVTTLSIGLALSNFGYIYQQYTDYNEKFDPCWILGISKKLAYLPLMLSADLTDEGSQKVNFRLGGEFQLLNDRFFLRFGTSSKNADLNHQESIAGFFAGYSAGFGIRLTRFRVDLSYLNIADSYGISAVNLSGTF